MNKSTPINQLPSSSPQGLGGSGQNMGQSQGQSQGSAPQGQFINDQHRHLIAQAHTAAQNFTVPVNTQLGGEYARDEDTTIQETLRQLNNPDSHTQIIQQLPPIPPLSVASTISQSYGQSPVRGPDPSTSQGQSIPIFSQPQSETTHFDPNMMQSGFNGMASQHLQQQHMRAPSAQFAASQDSSTGMWWFLGDLEDLKLAGVVAFLSLALALLPLSKAVQAYLPSILSEMPHADMIARAILTGIVFYITRGFLL